MTDKEPPKSKDDDIIIKQKKCTHCNQPNVQCSTPAICVFNPTSLLNMGSLD